MINGFKMKTELHVLIYQTDYEGYTARSFEDFSYTTK